MLMRPELRVSRLALIGAAVLAVVAIPAVSQDRPESILPPGFGSAPDAPPPPTRKPEGDTPKARTPDDSRPAQPATTSAASVEGSSPSVAAVAPKNDEDSSEEDSETPVLLVDIPPQVRRSTAVVGLLGKTDGDMGAKAFAGINGAYLAKVLNHIEAPIASRWASIVLRRALLSKAETPTGIEGADWVAARAALLVRMGEAVNARSLVQSVDVDQYTPALYATGMQASLASADPAALCPMTEGVDRENKDTNWTLSRAICSAFSGESSLASAQLDRARSRKGESNSDVLFAEKVVGAASNTRRAVTVNWDEIKSVDTWGFGMATATGVEIPERIMQKLPPRVRVWRAQAPLLSYGSRLPDAERAAAVGVLSSAALVDFYGAAFDETDPGERGGKPYDLLRQAFIGETQGDRVSALNRVWSLDSLGEWQRYARQIATARLAATIRPADDFAADASKLLSAMFAAGLDVQAAAWAPVVTNGNVADAWGLLAVGTPRGLTGVSESRIDDFGSASTDNGELRSRFLFAGLAGLGRVPAGDMASMAEKFDVAVGKRSAWSDALDEAVKRKSPGAVAILCAVGLQSSRWSDVPPAQLYRVVSALRNVGLEAEARMIAVEAVTRV